MLAFVGTILVVVVLIHFYLWKRLVKDPFRSKKIRRGGAIAVAGLAVLVPVTLVAVRNGHLTWLAWPGYLWLALMFYLLVALAVLEIPRLAVVLLWKAQGRSGKGETSGQKLGTAVGAPAAARLGTAADTPAAAQPDTAADAPVAARLDTGVGLPVAARVESGPAEGSATTGEADAGPAGTTPAGNSPGGHSPGGHSPAGSGTAGSGTAGAGGVEEPAGGIERRLLLARGAAIFAGLTAASVTGYGLKTGLGGPRLDRVQLPMAKLPRVMDGTRLAVVSDIHIGPLAGLAHTERIVRLINSVKADVVCVVGDLVDGSVAELGRAAAPLRDIESRHGAYFVTGNHEYYSGFAEWVEEVDRLGVRPLRNERVEINGLDLAGVNDLGGAEFDDGPDFARALGDRDPARPVVLMAHQPVAAVEAAPFGVDLQVSGHTHGGQMAPFNLLVKLQQPVVSGLGKVDGVPVYVTNGAGFWGPPVRVGAPPQVTLIELRSR